MATQRICHEFSRAGKCKVQNCKLSHDVHNNTNTDNKNTTKVSKKLQVTGKESSFSAWKLHVPLKPSRTRPLGNQLGPFLQEARRLVDQDVGVLQEVICTLAGEAGLKRLQELIEGNHLATLSTFQKSAVFTNQMLPFLGFVTHPRVLASLILEEEVGTIYSFLYGPAGRRALVLLGFLADILLLNKGQVAEGTVTHLEMSVVVFWQIIKVNPTALVNDELKPVAGRFKAIVEHYEGSQSPHSLGSVKLYMDRVLHRLSIGDAIPSATHPKQTAPKEKLLPLSNIKQAPPGGRHNNDFADICDIRILPTTEEILSPHTEYLPVKDHQQWHLDGVPGLLDRNFRLLRQDTIGQVAALFFSRHVGLKFVIQFRQFDHVQCLGTKEREWWNQSKRLQGGAFTCLVDMRGEILFCTAAEPPRWVPDKPRLKLWPSLWNNKDIATVALELIDPSGDDVQYILDRYRRPGKGSQLTLLEFPGILWPAFGPILCALQNMKQSQDLPFAALLAPVSLGNRDQATDVPPPAYAMKAGFRFNLSCLITDETCLRLRPGQTLDLQKLQDHSALDKTQTAALVNTLRRRIGLIQGPPGTGKSYTGVALIQVLLANRGKDKGNIGPIICVCYTNHALDQILEDLLVKRITTQVIRIGSRSRSEIVNQYSLRKSAFAKLKLHSKGSENDLKQFLQEYNPMHYSQLLNNHGDEGYQKAQHKRRNLFRQWINAGPRSKGKPRSIESLQDRDLESMSVQERQTIYQHWLEENQRQVNKKAKDLVKKQRAAKQKLKDLRGEVDLRCLRDAHVIGVTTSGLAGNFKMLQRLQSKVVLCEEAGEVLEAHLLTALLPSIEHAILIGDHQQLRPHIQDYNLSRENNWGGEQYSLDRSLFERLVCGMRRRLFWLDHRYPEAENSNTDDLGKSHSNPFEVEMTTALVTHLLRQGSYKAGDIAVLTPYLGQLHLLRRRLEESVCIVFGEKDQEDLDARGLSDERDTHVSVSTATALQTVRAATIDNFQGEEAKVVVISLVRSNTQRRCGFLRTSNRINVLLSRAKHGMYIIGNSATSGGVEMWQKVVDILKSNGNFGTHLELQCPRHLESPIAVSEPDHFTQYSPGGGCNQPCKNKLQYSHAVYCAEPCPRPLNGCDHNCPVKVIDANRRLKCGHAAKELPCWQAQDLSLVLCPVRVEKIVRGCNHTVRVACHIDVGTPGFKCPATMSKASTGHAIRSATGGISLVRILVVKSAMARINVLLVMPLVMFTVVTPNA
ncbi:hypothetical protein ASPCADRAFT_517135 [Aspergillus carbonarius ITEM 5010]|uniref:C3H1-type domain-containing protein n=1 Tax=Aspergillus carbonarius (strain ITEM 5010) TaxID=602072 RepID=A0A1R3RGH2_ASPC5|nr:hypothetical protein ASPCADRAFT_517135 [Aspergillus carbonarius ITEM 5010]